MSIGEELREAIAAYATATTPRDRLWLLDALVRDYSDPGMTIVDPCAGWGSTLVAARNVGRNAIGAEMDPAAFERCQHALSGDMAAYARAAPKREREADPDRPGLFDAIGGTP